MDRIGVQLDWSEILESIMWFLGEKSLEGKFEVVVYFINVKVCWSNMVGYLKEFVEVPLWIVEDPNLEWISHVGIVTSIGLQEVAI